MESLTLKNKYNFKEDMDAFENLCTEIEKKLGMECDWDALDKLGDFSCVGVFNGKAAYINERDSDEDDLVIAFVEIED